MMQALDLGRNYLLSLHQQDFHICLFLELFTFPFLFEVGHIVTSATTDSSKDLDDHFGVHLSTSSSISLHYNLYYYLILYLYYYLTKINTALKVTLFSIRGLHELTIPFK